MEAEKETVKGITIVGDRLQTRLHLQEVFLTIEGHGRVGFRRRVYISWPLASRVLFY